MSEARLWRSTVSTSGYSSLRCSHISLTSRVRKSKQLSNASMAKQLMAGRIQVTLKKLQRGVADFRAHNRSARGKTRSFKAVAECAGFSGIKPRSAYGFSDGGVKRTSSHTR